MAEKPRPKLGSMVVKGWAAMRAPAITGLLKVYLRFKQRQMILAIPETDRPYRVGWLIPSGSASIKG
eukprot:2930418-Pyramimonas_sp.AAC.1